MQVSTRQQGEKLLIAEDIVFTMVAFEGIAERMGTVAPNCVQVERIEVLDPRLADRPDESSDLNEFAIEFPVEWRS